MSQKESVLTDLSVKDLFSPLLKSVVKESNFSLSDQSEVYLLSVLESCLFTEALFSKNKETGAYEEPMLSERFLQAMQEEEVFLKNQRLKKLGDAILLKTGFFSEALKRKLSGLNYHIQMGSSVYGSLYSGSQNPVYDDLSQRFSGYVDLVAELGQKVNFNSPEDFILLFDRYFEGGSKKAQSKLIELGVVPVRPKKASNQ